MTARLLHGARISLAVGLAATALAALAGSLCGLVAGLGGGWIDHAIMRSIDTLMAFPYFLLAIAIIAALGPGLVNGMIAVAVVNIPSTDASCAAPCSRCARRNTCKRPARSACRSCAWRSSTCCATAWRPSSSPSR
jgi:hypothetical protein